MRVPIIPGTRLIVAAELPDAFEIATTYHRPITGAVLRRGERIEIRISGDNFSLRPTDRVAILK